MSVQQIISPSNAKIASQFFVQLNQANVDVCNLTNLYLHAASKPEEQVKAKQTLWEKLQSTFEVSIWSFFFRLLIREIHRTPLLKKILDLVNILLASEIADAEGNNQWKIYNEVIFPKKEYGLIKNVAEETVHHFDVKKDLQKDAPPALVALADNIDSLCKSPGGFASSTPSILLKFLSCFLQP